MFNILYRRIFQYSIAFNKITNNQKHTHTHTQKFQHTFDRYAEHLKQWETLGCADNTDCSWNTWWHENPSNRSPPPKKNETKQNKQNNKHSDSGCTDSVVQIVVPTIRTVGVRVTCDANICTRKYLIEEFVTANWYKIWNEKQMRKNETKQNYLIIPRDDFQSIADHHIMISTCTNMRKSFERTR